MYVHVPTYIITACLNDIPSTDGDHSHTQYVNYNEFEECCNKTEELEMRILALEAKASYQQYLFFSFLHRLHYITSGIP